ncbi:DUF5691 domain-containing protein [Rhodococcus sp. NPDC058521]|uniref:DUF5691 domain-containing protein n=1 Tax=Rhodococcus sp. NPDC058521 TaxID=3346536 RepID=UPI00364CCA8D
MNSPRIVTPGSHIELSRSDADRTLSDAVVQDLRTLIETRSWALPEWFDAAESGGFRAPAHAVAGLLELAAETPAHRENLIRLTGEYGQQLTASEPALSTLRRPSRFDPRPWIHGSQLERFQWLTNARTMDPESAVREIERTWARESGGTRAALLSVLETAPVPADEDLLECALDDTRKDVRERAVQILRRLPTSAYAERMAHRARRWFHVEDKPLRTRLVVRLPGSLDRSARRDGFEDVHFKNKAIRGWWLRTVVTAAPLSVWEEMVGSAREALDIPIESRWHAAMSESWRAATTTQQNARWAEAFLSRDGRRVDRRIAALVPAPTLTDYICSGKADSYLLGVTGSALLDGLSHPWPTPVARRVVATLEHVAARQARSGTVLGADSRQSHHTVMRSAATHVPLESSRLFEEAATRAADAEWRAAFVDAAAVVNRRRRMLAELR